MSGRERNFFSNWQNVVREQLHTRDILVVSHMWQRLKLGFNSLSVFAIGILNALHTQRQRRAYTGLALIVLVFESTIIHKMCRGTKQTKSDRSCICELASKYLSIDYIAWLILSIAYLLFVYGNGWERLDGNSVVVNVVMNCV